MVCAATVQTAAILPQDEARRAGARKPCGDGDRRPRPVSVPLELLYHRYFRRCGLHVVHDGSTRKWWAKDRFIELNLGPASVAGLPSDDLLSIIAELFDPLDFEKKGLPIEPALDALNTTLKRHSLVAYLDATGRCHLRNTGSGTASSALQPQRPLSQEEIEQRKTLAAFLDSASEDDFTERMLVPFFQRLGFHRVSPAGHKDKTNEFGKDLWMKLQLPTGHWLYFCAQIKREKLDSSGAGGDRNVATGLNQARMAIDHPIFDSDTNRKVLLITSSSSRPARSRSRRGHGLWRSWTRNSDDTSYSWTERVSGPRGTDPARS